MTTVDVATTVATAPPASTTTAPTTTTTPSFKGSIAEVDATRLGHSWRKGCPVTPEDLRLVSITHWGFDGSVHTGEIVVQADQARAVLGVFESLFDSAYPIVSVMPIGDLPENAEDQPGYSNTSGFHCRPVYGGSAWSQHAYGLAIDINPHLNPYVRGNEVWPAGSDEYVDRDRDEPGMITGEGLVVTMFESIGWEWGGDWRSLKDYHHFSANGR